MANTSAILTLVKTTAHTIDCYLLGDATAQQTGPDYIIPSVFHTTVAVKDAGGLNLTDPNTNPNTPIPFNSELSLVNYNNYAQQQRLQGMDAIVASQCGENTSLQEACLQFAKYVEAVKNPT
jgi:hypothetical protein